MLSLLCVAAGGASSYSTWSHDFHRNEQPAGNSCQSIRDGVEFTGCNSLQYQTTEAKHQLPSILQPFAEFTSPHCQLSGLRSDYISQGCALCACLLFVCHRAPNSEFWQSSLPPSLSCDCGMAYEMGALASNDELLVFICYLFICMYYVHTHI